MTLKTAAILLVFPLCGCSTMQTVDGSCKVFRPISNSTKDTAQTRREVIAHNRVYGAICKG
jgi:hypothetical protein